MKPRRLLPTLLATALVLAGCGVLPGGEPETYTQRPESGQCWEATQAQAAEWTDWLGGAPVDCGDEHTLETVAVLPVEGDYPSTAGGEFPEAFITAASDTCTDAWETSTQWAAKPHRFSNFFFYPAVADYDAGQRWVRCDIGIFAIGTSWASEAHQLEVQTSSLAQLRKQVKEDPNLVALCLDSESTQIGAFGELLQVADCDQPHLWSMVRESDLGESKGEKYPGDAEIGQRAEAACTEEKPEAVSGWFWIPPSENDWKRGNRTAFCFWAEVPVTSA